MQHALNPTETILDRSKGLSVLLLAHLKLLGFNQEEVFCRLIKTAQAGLF